MSSIPDRNQRYRNGCLAAHALELIGDRWALLVIRELMLGPRRFSSIKASLPGISANVLTQRLNELEADGLLIHEPASGEGGVAIYVLTEFGLNLDEVISALCRWGARAPGHDARLPLSPTSLMLSLRSLIDGARLDGDPLRVDWMLDHDCFVSRIDRQGFDPRRASVEIRQTHAATASSPIVVAGSPNAVASVVYGQRRVRAMRARARELGVQVVGDASTIQRMLDCIVVPDRYPMPMN